MKRALVPLLALLCSGLAHAEIVKWVDEKGKVHYSDQAPPNARKAKSLDIRTQPASPPPETTAAPTKSLAEKDQDFRQRQVKAEEAEKKAAEEKKQAETAQRNCAEARSYLKTLQDGGRVAKYNEKGERIFLDDAARSQSIAEAQKSVAQWCK